MALSVVHSDMFRPVAEASMTRATTGQIVLAQAKIAAIIYPALMVTAFFGAIGAAYLNPDLLKPASTLNAPVIQPVTAPAPETEAAPLVARRDEPTATGHIPAQRRVVIRRGPEHCIDQAAPDGRPLGKLCTPDPDGSKANAVGARMENAVPQ